MPSSGIGSRVIDVGGGGGGGGSGFTKTYWFNANDTATATSPIAHAGSATGTYLTNNGLGAATASYNPDSKSALWNPATNLFDFTSLKIGDTVEIRMHLNITNAAAQEINVSISLSEGTASAFERNVTHEYYKTASTSEPITALYRIFIDDEDKRTGGARFRFSSLDASDITVIDWFYQITEV